jgi:hypothetical protein
MKLTLVLFLFFTLVGFNSFSQTLPPAKPTAVQANQHKLENKIAVNWTAPAGTFTGYQIYYGIIGSSITDTLEVLHPAVSDTLRLLTLDTAYHVQMKSYRTVPDTIVVGLDSTFTTKKIFSTIEPTTPLRVTVGTLVAPTFRIEAAGTSHNKFVLEIKDTNKYETGFQVEITGNGSVTYQNITKSGSTLLETIGGLKPKTFYSLRVRAVKDGTFGPYSTVKTETTHVDFPPAAIVTSTTNCAHDVDIRWEIPTRIDEVSVVRILRATDNQNFELMGEVNPYSSPFIDKYANPGIVYQYIVHTQNSTGFTGSNTYTIHVPPFTAPSSPTGLVSLPNGKTTTSLTINWNKGQEDFTCRTNILSETEIGIKVNGGDLKILGKVSATENMYKISNLNPKDPVEILIRPYSDRGIIGEWVSTKDTTFGPPAEPSGFITVLSNDKIGRRIHTLEWIDNSNDEDYFEIHKSLDGVNYYQLAIVYMNYTKLIDTDLEEGNSYFYKVRSGSWAGQSNFVTRGPFYVDFSEAPNAPYGLNIKRVGNGVDLKWVDDSIKEKNYIVEKSVDEGATYALIATLDKDVISYRDENITEGRTYLYRVKATNPVGSSDYSNVRKITIAPASSAITINVYPNPISEFINLKIEGESIHESYDLKIFDQNNRLVIDKTIKLDANNSTSISSNGLFQGVYTMTLTNGKESISKKLIKL